MRRRVRAALPLEEQHLAQPELDRISQVREVGAAASVVGGLAQRHHDRRKGAVLVGADALECAVRLVVVLDDVRLGARRVQRADLHAVTLGDPLSAPAQEGLVCLLGRLEPPREDPRRARRGSAVDAARLQRGHAHLAGQRARARRAATRVHLGSCGAGRHAWPAQARIRLHRAAAAAA
eukprot:scaffold41331_cov65-Phaeocystis_antarctica.AAC.3